MRKIRLLTIQKKISSVIFLLYFFLTGFIQAQTNFKKLDANLRKIYKKSDFPGLAIALVGNDSLLFSGAYGFANVKEKIAFTANTIIPVASVSKTVIAFSMAKAFELGYFAPETPINEILPFKVINPHHPEDTIKVSHLFTHTSGILDNVTTFINSYQLGKRPDVSMASFLEECLSESGKQYSPDNFGTSKAGEQYDYSNIGSALAAYLIELRSGLSFDEFSQQLIFDPLQLESTHWFYDERRSNNYAKLYEVNVPDLPHYKELMNKDNTVKEYTSITYPDGCLKSSLNDLISYVGEIIKGYRGESKLLSKESYRSLIAKRFNENDLPHDIASNIKNHAMFWTYNSKGRLTHTGSDPGVFAVISIDLQKSIGRIVLINTNIDTDDNKKLINDLRLISAQLDVVE